MGKDRSGSGEEYRRRAAGHQRQIGRDLHQMRPLKQLLVQSNWHKRLLVAVFVAAAAGDDGWAMTAAAADPVVRQQRTSSAVKRLPGP